MGLLLYDNSKSRTIFRRKATVPFQVNLVAEEGPVHIVSMGACGSLQRLVVGFVIVPGMAGQGGYSDGGSERWCYL